MILKQKKTDCQRDNLKGKVKEMYTESFAVNIETNLVNTNYSKKELKRFNESGMLTELKVINPNGLIDSHYVYQYDLNQNMIESKWVERDGSFGSKGVWEYDNLNREIKRVSMWETGYVPYIIYTTYNQDGLFDQREIDSSGKCKSHNLQWLNPETGIVERHFYNEKDQLHIIGWNNTLDENGSFEGYSYDQNRQLTGYFKYINDKYGNTVEYHNEPKSLYDRPLHRYYKNEYDENGNFLSIICTRETGEIAYKYEYKNDEQGNWIEQFNYELVEDKPKDKLFWIVYKKRTIKYFDSTN